MLKEGYEEGGIFPSSILINYPAEFCGLKVFQLLLMMNQNELPYFHAFILFIVKLIKMKLSIEHLIW